MPKRARKEGIVNVTTTSNGGNGSTAVTVNDVMNDHITQVASNTWASSSPDSNAYDDKLIKSIYQKEIQSNDRNRVKLLDFTGYLERYLWTHFDSKTASIEHILSMIILINEKFRSGLSPIFNILTATAAASVASSSTSSSGSNGGSNRDDSSYDKMSSFYVIIAGLWGDDRLTVPMYSMYVQFIINSFKSCENAVVRRCCMSYLSMSIWKHLRKETLTSILQSNGQLRKHWKRTSTVLSFATSWVYNLIVSYLSILKIVDDNINTNELLYLEHFVELLVDLLSQIATRRFLNTLLLDMHFVTQCKRCSFYLSDRAATVRRLLQLLDEYTHFEVDDFTGKMLKYQDLAAITSSKVQLLQKVAFQHYPDDLHDIIDSSINELSKSPENVRKQLASLTGEQLVMLAKQLQLVNDDLLLSYGDPNTLVEFVTDVVVDSLTLRDNQVESIKKLAIYPNENVLFDTSSTVSTVLPLPKLNLQFLTIYDYLLRNYRLYALESSHQIREDIVNSLKKLNPTGNGKGVTFRGYSSMATPIVSIGIEQVYPPLLGESTPARVTCTVTVNLSMFRGKVLDEWQALRARDVLFLISVDAGIDDLQQSLQRKHGISCIRGAEIVEVKDDQGNVLSSMYPESKPSDCTSGNVRVSNVRILRLNLDTAQYNDDLVNDHITCYEGFNLLLRRHARENNFKSVLSSVRDVMEDHYAGRAIAPWLQDVFLGYGDPSLVNYRSIQKGDEQYDYGDTFIDAEHVFQSFPNSDVVFSSTDLTPPYQLHIHRSSIAGGAEKVTVLPNDKQPSPYGDDSIRNTIRYTPAQVEAIRSGMNEGLTLVVGPPGTGKTDAVIQIITNLYHNFPNQKMLLVTHSNSALNELFEKIIDRNIDPRHLLRLGSGESELRHSLLDDINGNSGGIDASSTEFSKQGRIKWSLTRRLHLLSQVQHLAQSIGIATGFEYSCETAQYFYTSEVAPRMKRFHQTMASTAAATCTVGSIFPFTTFFSDTPEALFTDADVISDTASARGCFKHIDNIFTELAEYRPYELLRSYQRRSEYLLTKQARIVAMTTTHAAISRGQLVQMGFKYDSMVMEEACQVLEVETLIPMVLQQVDAIEGCRLKRIVLIGDHHQLPPVVQNMALQRHCNLDQSLFARFLRLGVVSILLDKQGRARESIAGLYSWRYPDKKGCELGSLDIVKKKTMYLRANAGMARVCQIINVDDFQGKGEEAAVAHYYTNRGEAEYVVATYQYMRLLGYPASKISIITSYNGQKDLIKNILSQRCGNDLFGYPAVVTTIDKYQGQQNDYALISLVRTVSVGHMRDIRRFVVAVSRARLGLYVFCRVSLFANCYEISAIVNRLVGMSEDKCRLDLYVGEQYQAIDDDGDGDGDDSRSADTAINETKRHIIENVTDMGILVYQMVQQAQNKK